MPRLTRSRVAVVLAVLALAGPAAAAATAGSPDDAPSYRVYPVATTDGEPGLGYDVPHRAAVYGAGTTNLRLTWDAAGRMTSAGASAPTSVTTLDAITFTDQATSRTYVSQLVGACSLMAYSDDAGRTWSPSEGCGPGALLDHQTVGAGPYAAPLEGVNPLTDRAVYYCAQNGFNGACARSDDGGRTFGPAVDAYNTPAQGLPYGGACSAIHGHVRVAPDGTVYLPNKGCGGTPTPNNLTNSEFFGGQPALVVSEDDGLTWSVRPVPGAHDPDESDPSVDTDRGGRTWFGFEDGTNPSETVYGTTSAAKIAYTDDHGKTFSKPYDVSSGLGLKNVQFPEVVAGGKGRAAFAFLGTKGVGDDQHDGFVGEWHLYVATTTNGGKSWTTVDATPSDPVQRGCISLQGTSNKTVLDDAICSQRNLLDFNDITVDEAGRVLVAYTDGCTGACTTNPASGSKGAAGRVLRQVDGPVLFSPQELRDRVKGAAVGARR
ncbi:MAG: hypothetical protein JWN17_2597 [Frankiales bacterium]|nr:hypothetical protein [Frankiales bacterium]